MHPTPTIKSLPTTKLLGQYLKMSLVNNKTGQLWRQFGPEIKNIQNRVSEDKISMQVYDADYFDQFNPQAEFTKWATYTEIKILYS